MNNWTTKPIKYYILKHIHSTLSKYVASYTNTTNTKSGLLFGRHLTQISSNYSNEVELVNLICTFGCHNQTCMDMHTILPLLENDILKEEDAPT